MSTDITDSGIVGVETEPPADLVTRATDFLLEHIDGQQSTGWMMAAFAHSYTRILRWQCHQAFQMIKEQKARAEAAERSFSDLANDFMRVKMEKDAAAQDRDHWQMRAEEAEDCLSCVKAGG